MNDKETLSFTKMNGLGNEILVVDLRGRSKRFTPGEVRDIAQAPHTRFDQMMVLGDPRNAGTEAYVTIFNADGSTAEACGNGTRCIGWHVAKVAGRRGMTFETDGGLIRVDVAGIDAITVDMGEPKFSWEAIPLAEAFHDTKRVELQIGPIDNPILHSPSVANIGNPHATFWVDDVAQINLEAVGPLLENHPLFPERANITIAQIDSRSEITVRTWERGTGLTQACGSAACAAAVNGMRNNFTDHTVTVNNPGGALEITWHKNNRISMTGPVVDEYSGILGAVPAA